MHTHINISRLIGWIICLVLPLRLEAQEQSKAVNTEWEQQSPAKDTVLMNDILRLGDRAVKDNVISQKECISVMEFIRDSLPESTDLRIAILKQIRDEIDDRYVEMVRKSQSMFNENEYLAKMMIPRILRAPDDYVSAKERQHSLMMAGLETTRKQTQEYLEYMKPLEMSPWLKALLRLFFGQGVNQRPERWDQTVVPQMGGLYNIILPGGQPDYSWQEAPKMEYDHYPDRHFRR